ncbi:MAG: cell division protein FtsL [Porticoccaceae bacterium]|nr:cell division protein FtsL [Pseudomonadales bacterium]MCP5170752.1 cell division protein FtsL [Pseudomonadales bacterium]MCP5302007.1 cell division protein FtsL [Pseudomonadales bacterium]
MKRQVGVLALWVGVLLSSVAVIYTSHLCRQLYADLSLLEREKNSLQVEWGRYLLEQSSWASLSRVEQVAVTKLNMQVPEPDDIVMVQR